MTPRQRRLKGKRAENELYDLLDGDGLKVHKVDASGAGKREKGDIVLRFNGREYQIEVKRQEKLPLAGLQKLKGDSDLLIMRRNREGWKVYMDLSVLLLLLLNER